VFRALIWTLRQRRYAALAVVGLVVALICIGIGTFEIHRFQEKGHDNSALRQNAHAAISALTTSIVPIRGAAPETQAIQYRHVSVTGQYVVDQQQYVADKTQRGRQGFYVLTPLRTPTANLLVVRGFVPATSDETRPARVAMPPVGEVRVSGWLQTPQTSSDDFGRLGHDEIRSINPEEQAARLGTPVYRAALTLTAHQAGTAGLALVPLPGLGNPTGGAEEWQLASYVIQWYAFAVLALLLPFLVGRSEVRDARRRFLGIDPGAAQLDAAGVVARVLDGAAAPGGQLVARDRAEVARRAQQDQRIARATRLADRYGRSLGIDPDAALAAATPDGAPIARQPVVRDSSAAAHRSADSYHASYNDYLWQLALADGGLPELFDAGEPKRVEAVPEDADEPARGEEPPVS
jgi:cytochrome oxidase assembly protein ShyY1